MSRKHDWSREQFVQQNLRLSLARNLVFSCDIYLRHILGGLLVFVSLQNPCVWTSKQASSTFCFRPKTLFCLFPGVVVQQSKGLCMEGVVLFFLESKVPGDQWSAQHGVRWQLGGRSDAYSLELITHGGCATTSWSWYVCSPRKSAFWPPAIGRNVASEDASELANQPTHLVCVEW